MKFADDNMLGYGTAHRSFSSGDALILDAGYRRAHLPLVNSLHPDVIHEDGDYRMGTYTAERYSLVLPICDERLRQTSTFIEFENALRKAPFSEKINWNLPEKRKNLLHATICSGLHQEDIETHTRALQKFINVQPSKRYRLGGVFMGTVNTGRVYFKVYPEASGAGHAFGEIQSQLGFKDTHFFLVGYFNLTDHLDEAETEALCSILCHFRDETFWEDNLTELWVISTQDDLVLSGRILKKIVRFA